jgi:hypothetical protein
MSDSSPPLVPTPYQSPPFRRLRVYAFDPSLDTQLETAVINQAVVRVPWESGMDAVPSCPPRSEAHREPVTAGDRLQPGPIGEYLEVVDFDPASDCFYQPVDLNHPYLLAQDGLGPSEGSPQFHQQMVYAVAMTAIRNFERALGRPSLWAPRLVVNETGRVTDDEHVPRLRVYPHALREANAFYSPEKKALLFGYFPASAADPGRHLPGGMVFTCLSHDIIAHETTHALLDGMHRRFIEPSNPDVLAFHEAFADVVALFQHFSFPEVLRHQIGKTRGDLQDQSLLGQLAQQFGTATGHYGALRDAIGEADPETGRWRPRKPDPTEMERLMEPHARGALLVAAVFDGFLSIYRSRVEDLLRIATNGTGVLPQGELHPDLVNRLAAEAAKASQHVLNMCIRALDYLPPVDVTFGEYLRALITADYDLVRDDDRGYRIAMVEAFRRRGIYPRDVRTLSVDSLRWNCPTDEEHRELCFEGVRERPDFPRFNARLSDRAEIFRRMKQRCAALHRWIREELDERSLSLLGLQRGPGARLEVHSIRPARRVSPDGDLLQDLVIAITQRRPVYLSEASRREREPDFWFRGGSTLIVDSETYAVRYAVVKRVDSEARLERQRAYLTGGTDASLRATYFGSLLRGDTREPFSLLHRSLEEEAP